jgi:hypothetical protein
MNESWKAVAVGVALAVGSIALLPACSGADDEDTVGDIDEYCASIDMDDDICAAHAAAAEGATSEGEPVLGTKKAALISLSGASAASTLSRSSLTSISRASLSTTSLSAASQTSISRLSQ